MAEPLLGDVFGATCTQTLEAVGFYKSDLAAVGLTASANNTAESLFVALLLMARNSLTPEQRAADIANRNVTVEFSGQDLVDQGAGNVFLRDTFQVSLYRPTTIAAVDPDNY